MFIEHIPPSHGWLGFADLPRHLSTTLTTPSEGNFGREKHLAAVSACEGGGLVRPACVAHMGLNFMPVGEGKCVNAIRLGTVNVSPPRGIQPPVLGDDQPMKVRTMAALSRGSIGIRCTKLGGELP